MSSPVRRRRSITTSDSEWERLRFLAGAAGRPISRFVIERALETPVREREPAEATQPSLRRRVARDVILLALVEEWRVSAELGDDEWERLVQRATTVLEEHGAEAPTAR